jgi:hypothetical protein
MSFENVEYNDEPAKGGEPQEDYRHYSQKFHVFDPSLAKQSSGRECETVLCWAKLLKRS